MEDEIMKKYAEYLKEYSREPRLILMGEKAYKKLKKSFAEKMSVPESQISGLKKFYAIDVMETRDLKPNEFIIY